MRDCGVASLLMIIRYYRGDVNFEELEELCKVSKKGTSAYHIIKAGEFVGLQGKGYRLSFEEIKKTMLPCIVHVTTEENSFHYMVLYEIRKNDVIVADPSIGIKKIKKEKFLQMYNQTILLFRPIRVLPNEGENKKIREWIFSLIKKFHTQLLIILLYSVLSIFFIIATSFSMQFFLRGIESKKTILFWLILFLVLNILRFLFIHIRNIKLLNLDHQLYRNFSKEIFHKIISLPYRYYHNKTVGEVMNRFFDIPLIKNILVEIFIEGFLTIVLSFCAWMTLFFIHKTLAFFSLIAFLFLLIIKSLFTPTVKRKVRLYQNKKEQFVSFFQESLENYESIKGLHQENQIQKQFEKVFTSYEKETYEYEKLLQKIEITKSFLEQVIHIFLLYLGTFFIQSKTLTISQLFTFEFLLPIFFAPAYQLMEQLSQIKEGKEAFNRVFSLMKEKKKEGFVQKEIHGNIRLHHLTFSHDDQKNVLEDINLVIHEKEKIMIIGQSGVGKSTLFHLLMRYYTVPRGMIYLDDIDINDYEKTALQKQILLVTQNEKLFTDTIYNNITFFGKRNSKKVIQMSDLCKASDFINHYPLGYFTPLEQKGFQLSGGEKQRLILTRTLLLKFNILLIDEGLNQIDEDTEREILQKLFETFKEKTIIVISHRYRNTDLFDQVIQLKEELS